VRGNGIGESVSSKIGWVRIGLTPKGKTGGGWLSEKEEMHGSKARTEVYTMAKYFVPDLGETKEEERQFANVLKPNRTDGLYNPFPLFLDPS
jgi:hypothetical protein